MKAGKLCMLANLLKFNIQDGWAARSQLLEQQPYTIYQDI
jgi:hypothetical protein